MKNYNLAVIGGGASGLCAAINCARHNSKMSIVILERLPRVGKKILATGNGRCNLSNINTQSSSYHNGEFACAALNKYNVEKTLAFFNSVGLLTVTDNEGRVYPMSYTAPSVLDALRFEAERLTIEIRCQTPVTKIQAVSGKYIIYNGANAISAEKVIIACGGKASPSQGSDGSGFELLKNLGYKLTPLLPALVQIKTKTDLIKSLKGVRAKAKISVWIQGELITESSGEIQFTDFGISGIAAMEVSRYVSCHFQSGSKKSCLISIDFVPSLSKNEVSDYIYRSIKRNSALHIEGLLTGIVPKAVSAAICRAAGINLSLELSDLSEKNISGIAQCIKSFNLEATGTKGFESAQVTSGGVEVSEFNSQTLESKRHKGLYCCGEILDVDGGCGGFNLQWAWSSGLTAGKNAAL